MCAKKATALAFNLRSRPSLGQSAEGPRKKLNFLSFGVFEEDFEPMKRRIEAEGSG